MKLPAGCILQKRRYTVCCIGQRSPFARNLKRQLLRKRQDNNMTRKNDNLPFGDSAMQLDTNISRLVKLADDSNKPSSAFIKSLIDSALYELKQSETQRKPQEKSIILKVSWWKKTMGWAAMFAAACGTGLAVILSTMLK